MLCYLSGCQTCLGVTSFSFPSRDFISQILGLVMCYSYKVISLVMFSMYIQKIVNHFIPLLSWKLRNIEFFFFFRDFIFKKTLFEKLHNFKNFKIPSVLNIELASVVDVLPDSGKVLLFPNYLEFLSILSI